MGHGYYATIPINARNAVRRQRAQCGRSPLVMGALLMLFHQGALAQRPKKQYGTAGEIRVGVASWDFLTVDVQNRRLYGIGNYVVGIDADSVAVRLEDSTAGGGFVVAPELGRGMSRNGTIFRLTDGKTIGKLKVRGDAMVYDSVTKRAFLFGDTTVAVDLAVGRIAGRIVLGAVPESGVSDEDGHLYVNLANHDSVAVIDARTLRIVQRWPVHPCRAPAAMAIDRTTRRLFVSCAISASESDDLGHLESTRHALGVFNADNGRLVTVLRLPGRTETDESAFDPRTKFLFCPNAEGVLTIVHEDTADRYTVVQSLRLSDHQANKVVIDARTGRLFMPFSDARTHTSGVVIIASSPAR